MKLSPFQAALVAMVWVHGHTGLSRSRVAWLLWEMDDHSRPRHRISQLLYAIGEKTSVPPIVAQDDDLKPSPDLESDLGRLWVSGASRPVTGVPLARLQAPFPTRAFEEWVTTQRTTLRYLALERNAELLTVAEEGHEYELAVDAARAVLDYDPVNERALRSLVRALALGGSALQAEAAYERQAEIVRDILDDWTPSRETRRLLGEIDSLRARQDGPPTGRDIQHAVRLVGRKEELTTLRHICLGNEPGWQDVVLMGEPGVGKSRLLEELARQLELEDCRLVRVRSFAAEEGIAFNLLSEIARSEPFREAVRTIAPLWRKIIASALSVEPVDVSEEVLPEVPADSASRRVYEALRHLFDAVEGRVVILADGFGSADSSSLAALSFLRRRVQSPVRFVGTVASEAVEREGSQARYLRDVLEMMTFRLDLMPLSPTEAKVLVEEVSRKEISPRFIERIVELSGGIPLFLIELAQAEPLGDSNEVPDTVFTALHDLLTKRFKSVSPQTRILLNVMAVQRGPVKVGRLAAVCGQSVLDALISLDEAQSKRLVSSEHEGLRFRHGLIRDWVYGNLSGEERRFLHHATTKYLLAHRPEDYAADLATHFHHAGETEEAFRWAKESASVAAERFAFPDVIRLLQIAAASTSSPAERFKALASQGQILFHQGDVVTAEATLRECLSIKVPDISQEDRRRSRIKWVRAAVEIGKLDARRAVATLEEIEAAAHIEGAQSMAIDALDAQVVIANEAMQFDIVTRALARANRFSNVQDRNLKCRLELLKTFNFLYGDIQEGVKAADTAWQVASDDEIETLRPLAATRYIIVHWGIADLSDDRISQIVAAAEASANRTGNEKQLARVLVNVSTWYLDTGQLAKALQYLLWAERVIAGSPPEARAILDVNWGEYHLLHREYQQAEMAFKAGMDEARASRRDVFHTATAGYALCNFEMGRVSEAKRLSESLPSVAESPGGIRNFDPTTLAKCQTRWMEVTGRAKHAVEVLGVVRKELQDRNTIAWLKIAILEGRLRKKHKISPQDGFLTDALTVAQSRNLPYLVERLLRLTL